MVDPPAYPYFDIYPVVAGRMSSNTPREEQRSTTPARSTSGTMNPNPAYPRFDICEFLPGFSHQIEPKLTLSWYRSDPAAHPNADVRPTIRGVAINSRVAGQYSRLLVFLRLCLFASQSHINTVSAGCECLWSFIPDYSDLSAQHSFDSVPRY